MKTTIEIADALLVRAKETAHRDNTTLRALVEKGLHATLSASSAARSGKAKFKLVTFRGGSGQKFPDLRWDKIRDVVHVEGRAYDRR